MMQPRDTSLHAFIADVLRSADDAIDRRESMGGNDRLLQRVLDVEIDELEQFRSSPATAALIDSTGWKHRLAALVLIGENSELQTKFEIDVFRLASCDDSAQVRSVAMLCIGRIYRSTKNARIGGLLASVVSDVSNLVLRPLVDGEMSRFMG